MITMLLQAAAPAAGQAAGGSSWSFLLMLALMFLVMWLFMIRPQRQQQKKLEEMRNALKKGDKVITAGGIYGTVADIDGNTVLVKVDGEVKIRVDKSSINKDMTGEQPAAQTDKK
jgi:preprotein translocase subunit YajC